MAIAKRMRMFQINTHERYKKKLTHVGMRAGATFFFGKRDIFFREARVMVRPRYLASIFKRRKQLVYANHFLARCYFVFKTQLIRWKVLFT